MALQRLKKMYRRYHQSELVVIGSTFFSEGGDWKSIYLYARNAQVNGRAVLMVNSRLAWRQVLPAWFFAPRIVVNALASFDSWLLIALCLARRDVSIYLHETGYALDAFANSCPLKYRILLRIFSRNPLLCVSQQAARLYRQRFNSESASIIHECTGDDVSSLDPDCVHIVNVGSLNERKGVDLFSRVADLARIHHPSWKFHWVGGLASMNNLYFSPAVSWYGFMWQPVTLVKQCQVFFYRRSMIPAHYQLLRL